MLGAALKRIKSLRGEENYNLNHSKENTSLIKLKYNLKQKHLTSPKIGKHTDRNYYEMYKELNGLLEKNMSKKNIAKKFLNTKLKKRNMTYKQRMMISDLKWPKNKQCKSKQCKNQVKSTDLLRRDFMKVYDLALNNGKSNEIPLPKIDEISSVLSLIGSSISYQITLNINDKKRYITLLGYSPHINDQYFKPTNQQDYTTGKSMITEYIDSIKLENIMYDYNYLLLLFGKGKTQIDLFSGQLPKTSILKLFLKLCNKKINSDVCKNTYPSLRYHSLGFKIKNIENNEKINEHFNDFMKLITDYLNTIMDDKNSNKKLNKKLNNSIFATNKEKTKNIILKIIKHLYKDSDQKISKVYQQFQINLHQLFSLFGNNGNNNSSNPKYSIVYTDEIYVIFLKKFIKSYFYDQSYSDYASEINEGLKDPLSKTIKIKVS